jgi:hypothetical protein
MLVLTALGSTSCGRCTGERPEPSDDGQACASACAALITAACDRPGLARADTHRCEQACLARAHELAPAGCNAERRAYLACVSTALVVCDEARCAAAVCIEHRQGISGCDAEHAAFQRCIAPCLHSGVAHVAQRTVSLDGATRQVNAETVRAGCQPCGSDPERGAPSGSACQSPKVCAQRCCTCPDGRARFVARVCADGRCPPEGEVCALARSAGPDPCASE